MRQKIPSLVLLVFVLACSCSSDIPVLFPGDPGIQDLPSHLDLQPIAGDAPSAGFSTVEYHTYLHEKLSKKKKRTYTSMVTLKEQNQPIAVTQTEYFVIQPNGRISKQVIDVDVGVPGLVSLVHLTTKKQPPHRIQFRKVVRRLKNINGKLFPLNSGNRLSFTVLFAHQSTQGQSHGDVKELLWSYKYRITAHYEGYALADRVVPGKIYVIDRQEIDPDGVTDKLSIHYSESLGLVLKTVRRGENFTEETILAGIAK